MFISCFVLQLKEGKVYYDRFWCWQKIMKIKNDKCLTSRVIVIMISTLCESYYFTILVFREKNNSNNTNITSIIYKTIQYNQTQMAKCKTAIIVPNIITELRARSPRRELSIFHIKLYQASRTGKQQKIFCELE